MTIFQLRDGTIIRFVSGRTGETMLELKAQASAVIVWGARYRPDELRTDVDIEAETIAISGTLRDSVGPVVIFGAAVVVSAPYRVEMGAVDRTPEERRGRWNE